MMRIKKVESRETEFRVFSTRTILGIMYGCMRFPSLIVVAHDSFPNYSGNVSNKVASFQEDKEAKQKIQAVNYNITLLANFYTKRGP